MFNTPGAALKVYWNPTVFSFEIICVFLIVYLLLIWKLIAIMNKKQHNKLFMSSGYIVVIAIAILFPFGLGSIGAKTAIYPFINPFNIITNSIIKGYGVIGQSKQPPAPLLKGIPYIFGGQIIGALIGLILFWVSFKGIKSYFKNNEDYSELKIYSFYQFFKTDTKTNFGSWGTKEIVFIALFVLATTFTGFINKTNYDTDHFQVVLIQILLIGFITIISSYFGYFEFHLLFPLIIIFVQTIELIGLKGDKDARKELRKEYLKSFLRFIFITIVSIIIPILVGFMVIAIKIKQNVNISLS